MGDTTLANRWLSLIIAFESKQDSMICSCDGAHTGGDHEKKEQGYQSE